jgi:hypothetical protein
MNLAIVNDVRKYIPNVHLERGDDHILRIRAVIAVYLSANLFYSDFEDAAEIVESVFAMIFDAVLDAFPTEDREEINNVAFEAAKKIYNEARENDDGAKTFH